MLELTLDDLLQLVKKASFHLPPLDPAVEAIMRDWRKPGRNPRHLDRHTFIPRYSHQKFI